MSLNEQNVLEEKRLHIRKQMIEAIAETMDLYGATHSSGQLYGVMFFENRPMTLDEMKTQMNMSKSNMSYAVRSLMESRMVKKLEEKQERKELYAAETNFFTAFQNFFTYKLQREVDVMTGAIDQALPELTELILQESISDEERKLALQDLHKLRHAKKYYEWLQNFVYALEQGAFFEEEPE
ncbi:GbsR/MarR family transcriptional regulator [Brevibacillus brevis]|uniref:GbsR/MarR family transcriptional regulator n=1 Tax=Brevibacillus brevis TaxID=1393 RepID=UPI001C8D309F|nr:transcriptional regulator [Brevibacillus brevis]MBY0087817.1 transcriptional regulator [Brevibacillus brevis]